MDKNLIVHSSRIKLLICLLLCLFGAGWGLVIVNESHDSWMGWLDLVFFGAFSLLFMTFLFDLRPRLVIDEHGVYDPSMKMGMIPWQDLEEAYVTRVVILPCIGLRLRDPETYIKRFPILRRLLFRLSHWLGFKDFYLIAATLSLDPELICEHINKRRDTQLIPAPRYG